MIAYRNFMTLLAITFGLGGCIHEDLVTMRPSFAYPQNLVSLCHGPWILDVANVGEFMTGDYTNRANRLLLNAQLLSLHPSRARHLDHLVIEMVADEGLVVKGVDASGRYDEEIIPVKRMRCEGAELVLSFASKTSYFWASAGTHSRELVLWTNRDRELILQNRWREVHRGIVGGTITGDAWARFQASPPSASLPAELVQDGNSDHCEALDGHYGITAQVVARDGTEGTRSASAQFFREEIVGTEMAALAADDATHLTFLHSKANEVDIEIYGDNGLLATRTLAKASLACNAGKWEFRGRTQLQSAWLLFAAAGGISREDLTLWKDTNGDLLIEGLFTRRGVLFLIPIGGTENTFMAFPRLDPTNDHDP